MCNPNFYFVTNSCQLQCAAIPFTIGNNINNNSMCDCETNY